jgi:hypothetical protein
MINFKVGFVQVWDKNGGLWFSSSWSGTMTVQQVLSGGNLVVPHSTGRAPTIH